MEKNNKNSLHIMHLMIFNGKKVQKNRVGLKQNLSKRKSFYKRGTLKRKAFICKCGQKKYVLINDRLYFGCISDYKCILGGLFWLFLFIF